MRRSVLSLLFLSPLFAADTPWPVNGGPYNIRYTELSQITPANVSKLQVAWTWDAHEAFKDSEMQSNPIVVDGILYATTPKMHVASATAASRSIRTVFSPPTATFFGASTERPANRSRNSVKTGISTCAKASTVPSKLSVSAPPVRA